jgi:regulator of chromosome condensation
LDESDKHPFTIFISIINGLPAAPLTPTSTDKVSTCTTIDMAPTKPTKTSNRKAASTKRRRENDASAAAPDRREKRQKISPATETLIQAQAAGARAARQQPPASALPVPNRRPTDPLNIYVFGANSGGELGLGPSVKSGNVGRPRLNPYLSGSAGIVQVSLGAMHGVALTLDNRILTWGVNDHGALGRDTSWEGGLVDMGGDESDSDEEGELNPKESTPAPVDMSAVPPDTIFTQVAATDNATFALTSTGRVYGWGTFRVSPPIVHPPVSIVIRSSTR